MHEGITEYLRRRCLALRPYERADLAGMLLQSLEPENPLDKAEALERMADITADTAGVDLRTEHRRQLPIPDVRCAFVYLATQMLPVSQSDLARFLGIKPCTANYYTKRMAQALALPGSNPALVTIYRKLYEEYAKNEIN